MGMHRVSYRQKYPVIYAFGEKQEFLDTEAAIEASVSDRIRSIWPFIVSRVIRFQAGLKARERVGFDAEDTLIQLWVALAERDGKWSPSRGKYITFAGVIIDRELCSIRDKARTVEAPRNTSCRLKEYEAEERAGTLTEGRRKTAEDIRRTNGGIHSIADEGVDLGGSVTAGPLAQIIERETAVEKVGVLREALSQLTPRETDVLVRITGIFGTEARSAGCVAAEDGCSVKEVRTLNAEARRKVRGYLTSIGHPAAAETTG